MNLRKEQQDGLWEGVVQSERPSIALSGRSGAQVKSRADESSADGFDKYWSVGSRLVPLPSLGPNFASPATTRSPTPLSGNERAPDSNGVRSMPVKVYLPEGAQPLPLL
jgi:hypothetical protein